MSTSIREAPVVPVQRILVLQPEALEPIRNGKYHETLREPRLGVLLHFDDSSNDRSAVEWFTDPRCEVSYNYLVMDDGRYHEIAPPTARAWHAGVCRPSNARLTYQDANSAFVGVAVATNSYFSATIAQVLTVAWLTRRVFDEEGWSPGESWRITGHDLEAWPRGRRSDPTGYDAKRPILTVDDVRELVRRMVG